MVPFIPPVIPPSVSFCEFGPATTLPNRPSSSPFPIWEWCSYQFGFVSRGPNSQNLPARGIDSGENQYASSCLKQQELAKK